MAASNPADDASRADLGVIGGSGFYEFLTDVELVTVATPYGPPSEPVAVGEVAGRRVAFLPRHGRDHRFPPHRVPYRANLWALRSVGVRQVLAPSAVGSLRHDLPPGALVVPDQVVDRTTSRPGTFFDEGAAVHVSFADPYCPSGRRLALAAAQRCWPSAPVDGGTLVVIEGPRFSSRAESRGYAEAGCSVIGMTGMPEAVLARELALCYTPLALVTDHDAGVEGGPSVTHADVLEVFAANVERLRGLMRDLVPTLPEAAARDCGCGHALDGIRLPFPLP